MKKQLSNKIADFFKLNRKKVLLTLGIGVFFIFLLLLSADKAPPTEISTGGMMVLPILSRCYYTFNPIVLYFTAPISVLVFALLKSSLQVCVQLSTILIIFLLNLPFYYLLSCIIIYIGDKFRSRQVVDKIKLGRPSLTFLLVLSIFLITVNGVVALPADPAPFNLMQPDNFTFQARLMGDERSMWTETLEGYSIDIDTDEWWKYVSQEGSSDSRLATAATPSEHIVGKSDPKALGLPMHLHYVPPSRISGTSSGRETLSGSSATDYYEPIIGEEEVVVLLIEFTNEKHGSSHTTTYFDNLFFSGTKSLRNYYKEASYDKLNISGYVVPKWYTSNHTMEHYGEDAGDEDESQCVEQGLVDSANGCAYELAREAVLAADNDVDFSQYDKNNDGVVDHVLIVHAGGDQAVPDWLWGTDPDLLATHRWHIDGCTWGSCGQSVDGVKVQNYMLVSEDDKMGATAHELGHDLTKNVDIGLPELYDSDMSSDGIGYWGIMAAGGHKDPPVHPSAWSKYMKGWVEPQDIPTLSIHTPTSQELIVSPVETNPTVYRLKTTNPKEYFLVTYREKTGFDTKIPGEGLLIWHIDDDVEGGGFGFPNDNEDHKRVDLEEAHTGAQNLDEIEWWGIGEWLQNRGDFQDPWANWVMVPCYNNQCHEKAFFDKSEPNSKDYSGNPTYIGVFALTDAGSPLGIYTVFQTGKPMQVPDILVGATEKDQTWEFKMEVGSIDNLKVTLDWITEAKLHLTLISPSETEYESTDPRADDGIFVEDPESGTWTIKVYGKSLPWSSSYVRYTLKSENILDEEIGDPDGEGPGGVNFTSIDLVYISTCDPAEEGVTFVVRGKEAKPGDPTVNANEETKEFLEYFKTGLTVPNYKQWISLPIGDVDVMSPFEETEASRIMLQADVDMKFSDAANQCQIASDVYSEKGMQSNWWYRTAFIPGSIKVNSSGCEIYITDSEFEIETEMMQPTEGEWAEYYSEQLWDRHQPAVKQVVNTDSKYDELRDVYEALAMAQWYKKLNRDEVPLGEMIDTEDTSEIQADTEFNRNYWAGQSNQYLCSIPGYPGYYLIGGVSFGNLETDSEGEISEESKEIIDKALTESFVKVGDEYYIGGKVEAPLPDIIPAYMWTPQSIHLTNEDILITIMVKNDGAEDAGQFKVKFYDNFTHLNGYTSNILISEETVNNLAAGELKKLTTTWNTGELLGSHSLIAVVDSGNAIIEANELNNEKIIELTITTPYPKAEISSPERGLVFTYGDNITFEGSGTDIQDGELSDESLVWTSSLDGEIGTGNSFIRTDLSHGTHIITLTVTDGEDYSDIAQTGIIIEYAYPEATIISPAEEEIFIQGDPINFVATATDAEDGELSGSSLIWDSSLDGELGSGESFTLSELSAGTHTITLTATDSDDMHDIKSVNIILVDPNSVFLNTLSDGSTQKDLIYTEAGDQTVYLNFPRDLKVEIITATLDVSGRNINPGPWDFTEEFTDTNYMAGASTADWGNDQLTAKLDKIYQNVIQNPDFDNNAQYWQENWYGVGNVDDGGKCPWNHNHACWGWEFTKIHPPSWSKIWQDNVDLTNVEKIDFMYMYGGQGRSWAPTDQRMSFFVDGNMLWSYAPDTDRPPLPLQWGDIITLDVSGYSGSHTLSFRADITGPSTWYWYFLDGGTYWGTFAVDTIRAYNEDYIDSVAVSKVVYNSPEKIYQVQLDTNLDLNGGSIQFYVSADNGAHWEPVKWGEVTTLQYPGYKLRWKAEISPADEDSTPVIHWVELSLPRSYPENPSLDVSSDGDLEWSHSGRFRRIETTGEFGQELQDYVDTSCTSDPCRVPLEFHSDSIGKLRISNINVQYLEMDVTAPVIQQVSATPDPSHPGDSIIVRAKVTDNKEVSYVTATLEENTIGLNQQPDAPNWYRAALIAPSPGEYIINITAVDVSNLRSNYELPITVISTKPDLIIQEEDLSVSREMPSERENISISAVVHNYGDVPANNFYVELLVDEQSIASNLVSVSAKAEERTEFSWIAEYGEHTIEVKADSTNRIAEEAEDNNDASLDITVIDITPPPAPELSAEPANWTINSRHTIDWEPVEDTHGIARYEFLVDYGEWASVGLETSFTTPSQPEGVHTVFVRAVDNAGNIGPAGSVDIFIDQSAPNAPFVREWHTGKSWSAHDSPYYTWNDPGDIGSGVTHYITRLDNGAPTTLYNNTYHPTLQTGMHTFNVKAVDALGHESTESNEVTVYIDTTQPGAPNVNSPTHPDSDKQYIIKIPVFDLAEPEDHSGIWGYYYTVDNSSGTIPNTRSMWTYNTSIEFSGEQFMAGTPENFTGLADGTWYFHVRAIDNVGNLGETAHFKFNVISNRPPEVVVLAPSGGEFWSVTKDIVWNATDLDNDTLDIWVKYMDTSDNLYSIADNTTNTGTYSWDTTQIADGEYKVRVEAFDGLLWGNNSSADWFTIDNTDPVTTDDADTEWHTSDITVTLTAQDPATNGVSSGIADTYYIIYHDEAAQETKSVNTDGQPVISYEDDDNWLEYWSVDNAGNEEIHTIVKEIKLDKTAPELSLLLEPEQEDYSHLRPLPVQYTAIDLQIQGTPSNELTLVWDIDDTVVEDPADVTKLLGTHTLTLTATDLAGNQNSASVQFTVYLDLVGEGQFKITPEALMINPGVLTVHVNFPEPYNGSEILWAVCDYAREDFISDNNIHFRREDIEAALAEQGEKLDTHFEVNGKFLYNGEELTFKGSDDISEILYE